MAPDVASKVQTAEKWQLPSLIVSPSDIMRLQHELVVLDDAIQQAKIRNPDKPPLVPRSSSLFEELGIINKLDWLQKADRERTRQFLDMMLTKAPKIHISFAADPSADFINKLVVWFRNNIHPLLLIRIGLQPTIAAGCVIRTENHVFDLSLRRHFSDQRGMLVDKLRGMT
jgi:hypothetical protein